MRAVSSVHPFNAPNAEIMPTSATHLPQVPPKIVVAASAKGAFEPDSAASGDL